MEETISKKELQQRINDMGVEENIWDILCDEYGLSPGKWDDCECKSNYHKEIIKGEIRCQLCDITGINYNGGLTSDEESSDDEPEEVCCKCETDEDVEQCSKCGKYTCVDCDGGDMGTYKDGHTYCENCFPE